MSWIAGIAQVAGSVIGELMSQGKEAEARALLDRTLKQYRDIEVPDQQQVEAEQLPEFAVDDTDGVVAQKAALARMQQMADQGGLTLEDQAAMNKLLGQASRQETAGRNAIKENFAQRGALGSGAEMAMAMQNQQQSGQRAYEAGMDRAAMAQKRAYDAIMGGAQLGGQMRDQDMRKAAAKSEIDKFNAASRDRAKYYNADAGQRDFDNQMRKVTGQAGLAGSVYQDRMTGAANDRALGAGLGAAAGKGINSILDEEEDKK